MVCNYRDERHEEQVWAIEQVLGVVRNPRLLRKGSWLVSAATLLLGHAFFAITTPPVKEVCLNHLIKLCLIVS